MAPKLTYDPEYASALEPYLNMLQNAPQLPVGDIESRRQGVEVLFDLLMPAWPTISDVDQQTASVKAADGYEIPVHIFTKRGTSSGPGSAVFYLHGGGYFSLKVTDYKKILEMLVSHSGVPIIAPDMRLAPEYPFSTPINDSYTALKWVHDNAGSLNVDTNRVGLMGDSAGGGLAAGVAIKARDEKLSPPLKKQLLIGGMLDDRSTATKHPELEGLLTWSCDDNETGWQAYIGKDNVNGGDGKVSSYAAAARVENVEGLPPLYLEVPNLDIFLAENLAYATRFVAAGIDTEVHIWSGLPHSFELFSPHIKATLAAVQSRVRAIQKL